VITTEAEGIVIGAAYRPEIEIVPRPALPPALPFTSHVTAVLLVPETLAENCFVPPSCRVALVGVIEMTTGLFDEMETVALAEAAG
jgi:hypothetical protein